jgi:FHA domain-containing protein
MAIWITVIAIALVGFLFLGWIRPRRGAQGASPPPGKTPTVPVELGATIRSYIIPNRWLRAPPPVHRTRPEDAAHPRYAKASVERIGESGAPAGSWPLLRGRTRLGRDSDNHVVLDDERVSLHHALITVREGGYWLEDLGSTNGTFLGDDTRVMTAHALADGDQLRLGGVVLTFRGTAE